MPLQDRIRGQISVGGFLSNQTAHFSSSPLAAPSITFSGQSDTADGSPRFVFSIVMNRESFGSTSGAILAQRAVCNYHFEDTAGGLLGGELITAAVAGNTSGLGAIGVVIPNSTVAGGFGVGRLICSSTGECTLAITTSSGVGTTGYLVVTLPSGLMALSTQVDLTS